MQQAAVLTGTPCRALFILFVLINLTTGNMEKEKDRLKILKPTTPLLSQSTDAVNGEPNTTGARPSPDNCRYGTHKTRIFKIQQNLDTHTAHLQSSMLQLPTTDNYIVYPGSGTDFSPLLSELTLAKEAPALLQSLYTYWTRSELLMCDNSEQVAAFFYKLKPGYVLYDKNTGIYCSEPAYKQGWIESGFDRVIVMEVFREKQQLLAGKETDVVKMVLKVEQQGMAGYAKAIYVNCDFNDLAAWFEAGAPRQTHIINSTISGFFLIGMPNGQEFLRPKLLKKARFVVADLPPRHFPDFLPLPVRLSYLGRQDRSYTAGLGAAIYLHKDEFGGIPVPVRGAFWLVPGLFAARDCSAEKESPAMAPPRVQEIYTEQTPLDEPGLHTLLDEIDRKLKEGSGPLLLTETGSTEKLTTIIGSWLVRRGVVSGQQVSDHIQKAATACGADPTVAEYPKDEKTSALLRSWIRGK